MKKILLAVAASMLAISVSPAQTIFNPSFTSGTPGGYTTVTQNGGTVTYSGGEMHTGDASTNLTQAYITSSSTVAEGSVSLTTQLVYSSTYTSNGGRAYSDFPVLSLYSSNSNNPLLEVDSVSDGYLTNSQINISQGMGYSGSTTTGDGNFAIPGLNSLSGVPVTLNIVTTYTNFGVDPANSGNNLWELTNIGTISAGNSTQDIDLTSTGSISSSWDPINNPLTLQLGITPGFFAGGSGNGGDGFLTPPATVDISSLDIAVTTPEPSVSALMLGGAAVLVVITLRRKTV